MITWIIKCNTWLQCFILIYLIYLNIHHNIIIDWLTKTKFMRCSPVSLQEPPLPQPVRQFPALYRTCTFITAVHKSPPAVPNQSQMNPVHNLPFHFLQCILTLAGHLCLAYPTGSSLQVLPPESFMHSFSPQKGKAPGPKTIFNGGAGVQWAPKWAKAPGVNFLFLVRSGP